MTHSATTAPLLTVSRDRNRLNSFPNSMPHWHMPAYAIFMPRSLIPVLVWPQRHICRVARAIVKKKLARATREVTIIDLGFGTCLLKMKFSFSFRHWNRCQLCPRPRPTRRSSSSRNEVPWNPCACPALHASPGSCRKFQSDPGPKRVLVTGHGIP